MFVEAQLSEVGAPSAIGAGWSGLGLAVVLGLFGRLIWLAVARRRTELRRARQETANVEQAASLPPLEAGPAVILGPVELASDQTVAARVEVDQLGSENESSGTWTTRWTESDRRVTTRPFYIRRGDERVRVDPTDIRSASSATREGSVFLVDAMDGLIFVDTTHRTRFAELTPGEYVHAVGLLRREPDPERDGSAYRGAAGLGWVLRPDPTDGLLLSSEPLDARFRRRARAQTTVAIVASIALALFAGVEVDYIARIVAGEDVTGTVVSTQTIPGSDDGSSAHHGVLVSVPGEPQPLLLAASEETTRSARPGSAIPVRVVRFWRGASALGPGARGTFPMFLAGMVFYVVIYIVIAVIESQARKWYDGAKVVDDGPGRLDDNRGTRSS